MTDQQKDRLTEAARNFLEAHEDGNAADFVTIGDLQGICRAFLQSRRAAAGADPEVVEAATKAVRDEVGSHLCSWKDHKGRTCRGGESLCLCKAAATAALLANATDEMPPARRAEGEQPSTSYVRTEK